MDPLSSPTRFFPPISPRRAISPGMSPRRIGRSNLSSEDSFRDLSPTTTYRAFAEIPLPYDTSIEEFKIFACIENLTPAEKDLGTRVAKAAHRLKSWCTEIQQWGWSRSFEQPSEEYRERRRKSLEGRIREHVKEVPDSVECIKPLEYWGSLLSVEVEAHEARLDEIADELATLEIEDFKEHILDIHGPNRSRPSSSYESKKRTINLLDDFEILITQTLLQALPYHSKLKSHLDTWSARIYVLRQAPRFLDDLKTSQKAMILGWDAAEPLRDSSTSNAAFSKWKEAIDTISDVLQDKVTDLGQRLDRMLDMIEGREDVLPDNWIDDFERLEADHGRWTAESRRRILDAQIRRIRASPRKDTFPLVVEQQSPPPETSRASLVEDRVSDNSQANAHSTSLNDKSVKADTGASAEPGTHVSSDSLQPLKAEELINRTFSDSLPEAEHEPHLISGVSSVLETRGSRQYEDDEAQTDEEGETMIHEESAPQFIRRASVASIGSFARGQVKTINVRPQSGSSSPISLSRVRQRSRTPSDHFSKPEKDITFSTLVTDASPATAIDDLSSSPALSESFVDRPETPPYGGRRDSLESIGSNVSFASSPPSIIDDSPSIRNASNRQAKAPRPPLNSAMAKRRPLKIVKDSALDNQPPWPPTKFAQHLSPNETGTMDFDRKISDIIDTLPGGIRLLPEDSAKSVKSPRSVSGSSNVSRSQHLRASRTVSGIKSPEITLSPVKQDHESASNAGSKRHHGGGGSDIRLYHLNQPGREHPIKLFIRRVGENGERVMVRVGGGWADLGEYLRTYVGHHSLRTTSDGNFEIIGIEAKSAQNGNSPRPGSVLEKTSANNTPAKTGRESALGKSSGTPNATSTPATTGAETSLPSTGSSRHSWTGNEVGLAGPKARKLDLTGDKLEWVEKMTNEARRVSGHVPKVGSEEFVGSPPKKSIRQGAESRNGAQSRSRGDFGDLGKVGGTKRVFLRGGGNEH